MILTDFFSNLQSRRETFLIRAPSSEEFSSFEITSHIRKNNNLQENLDNKKKAFRACQLLGESLMGKTNIC